MSQPTFSVVFLTWNPGDRIANSIRSVFSQSYEDLEVIVVDNDSEDGTVDRLNTEFDDDRLRVYENDRNLGFADGIEVGIEHARGEYICCYNHDTTFADGYFETLSKHVSDDVVLTTARENHRVSSTAKCVRLISIYGFTVPYDVTGLSGRARVNYVPGDGAIVPRQIYQKVLNRTVFDARYHPRCEDVNLSLTLENADVDIYAVLDTYSVHPDKAEFYAPTVANFLTLAGTTRARMRTFWANDRPVQATIAAMSIFTHPLFIYSLSFPRPTAAFRERTGY
ncbi:glycosyltransferase family 2 protein [Halosimplex rubrum]|uniref:Glycosyltransferase family 2 protein n=1 Tax=Halosimplex rubrum TaxID=869889 RepID=A0A7D5NZ18_9EURY|nr:glycosyltransferase [Halosimplex rubrum]QLH76866.1 glycosyltransferase family 2 protein [Halosimplex rubrum]